MRKNDIGDLEYTWKEWEMMNRDQESAIDIPGETCFFIYFFKILPMQCISFHTTHHKRRHLVIINRQLIRNILFSYN